jgi:DNA-binding transcriptional ArsR family regulator
MLRERPRTVGELTAAIGCSQPGTSKHLRVLREAGLVRVTPDAQRRVYTLEPGPLAELDAWLAPYRQLWEGSLDALGAHLDRSHAPQHSHPPDRSHAPQHSHPPDRSHLDAVTKPDDERTP